MQRSLHAIVGDGDGDQEMTVKGRAEDAFLYSRRGERTASPFTHDHRLPQFIPIVNDPLKLLLIDLGNDVCLLRYQ